MINKHCIIDRPNVVKSDSYSSLSFSLDINGSMVGDYITEVSVTQVKMDFCKFLPSQHVVIPCLPCLLFLYNPLQP